MKLFFVLLLMAGSVWAQKRADCDIVNGIFPNSSVPVQNIRFETLVDVFSLNNAKTFALDIAGEEVRFLRSDMDVDRQTKLIFVVRKGVLAVRAAHIIIDRTPRQVLRSREFYGFAQISPEIDATTDLSRAYHMPSLSYNFYCRF